MLVAFAQRSGLGAVWDAVHDAFDDHHVPTALVGVPVLGFENPLVEIEAVAAIWD